MNSVPRSGPKRCFKIGWQQLSVPGARPKLISYSDSPYPKPHSTHFLAPTGNFERIYRTEPVIGRNRTTDPGLNTARFSKSAQEIPVGTKKRTECGFGYGGSKYEVSFGLAHRNGQLSPFDPENPDTLTLRSGPGTRNRVHIRSPAKFRVPVHIYPEMRWQRLNLHSF